MKGLHLFFPAYFSPPLSCILRDSWFDCYHGYYIPPFHLYIVSGLRKIYCSLKLFIAFEICTTYSIIIRIILMSFLKFSTLFVILLFSFRDFFSIIHFASFGYILFRVSGNLTVIYKFLSPSFRPGSAEPAA